MFNKLFCVNLVSYLEIINGIQKDAISIWWMNFARF